MRKKHGVSVERLQRTVDDAVRGGYGKMLPYLGDPEGLEFRRCFEIDLSMGCENPVGMEFHSRDSATHGKKVVPIRALMKVQCRRCETCRENDVRQWMARAFNEAGTWPRSYMGTVTMSPEQHYELDARVHSRLWAQAVNMADLSESELFTARAGEFGLELTKYFKRLRKGDAEHAAPRFRYLLVAEAHPGRRGVTEVTDRPHFHLILHEVDEQSLVRGNPNDVLDLHVTSGELEHRRVQRRGEWMDGVFVRDGAFLREKWELGFTTFELITNPQAIAYVCGYINKAKMARVRASERYGDPSPEGQQTIVQRENSIPQTLADAARRPQAKSASGLGTDGGSHG